MSYLQAIILGIIQGITEFLPISSTAHMIIAEKLFGLDFYELFFEMYLHLASALAVIVFFYRDLINIIKGSFRYLFHQDNKERTNFYFSIYIISATIITGFLGLTLKNLVVDIMKSPVFIGGALLVTGVFLILIERFHNYGKREEKDMVFSDSIIVGLGQTLAVLPGISRSGSTLLTGLWAGLSRETAVRYSFLLLIPVILGSTTLAFEEIKSGGFLYELGAGPLIISFLTSFIFSIIGIIWLIDILRKKRLIYLAIYCFIIGILLFIF